MTDQDKRPRKVAAKLTPMDRDAIELIKACNGVIDVDVRGRAGLESDSQLKGGDYRVRRLIALGVLEPGGDHLLFEDQPQTYRLVTSADGKSSESQTPTG